MRIAWIAGSRATAATAGTPTPGPAAAQAAAEADSIRTHPIVQALALRTWREKAVPRPDRFAVTQSPA